MFVLSKVEKKEFIDIFLSTLPYEILIKPFKKDANLQKKLAGFRLIETSSPPKKIIPILREEIIKGNLEEEIFIKEWEKIYADLVREVELFSTEEIAEKIPDLLKVYKPEIIFSIVLFLDDKKDKEILEYLESLIDREKEEKVAKEKELIDKSVKVNKKLVKEVEKLQEKLIQQEKKNIMEVEKLTKKMKEQEKEILGYKNKIAQLEREKEILEERIEKIGFEFEKRINKVVENSLVKEKQTENLKVAVNRLALEVQQQKIEFANNFFEIKEILNSIIAKIEILVNSPIEEAATTKENEKYSLVEDLAQILKNN